MKRFSSELEELKKFELLVKNPVGGGGNRRVAHRLWRVNDAFCGIFPPLGEGRILNELASCKNSGEGGISEVYNVLEEVKRGVGQEVAVFRHAEFISASQFVILRCQRHSPIRCWYNFKASLRVAKNLKLAPSLALPHRRGNITISPLPLGEGRISMRVFTSIRNSGEGVLLVSILKARKGKA